MRDNSDYELQRMYPASIREYMSNLPQEEFLYWAQFMNSTVDFKPDPSPIQVGNKTFVIPLLSCYLEDLYLKAINHSIKITVTFQNALISGSAANISVLSSGLKLVIFYEDLPMSIGKQLTDMYSKGYGQDYLSVLNWRKDSYTGWYPFTGNEQLWFTTAANQAEVPRVVTITPYVNTTATTPTAGYFQLVYTIPECPGSRRTFISAPIAYGATAGAINTAIANMLIPDISVTVGSSTMTSSGLTLTISGISVNKDYHCAYRGRMVMYFRP